jgi:2-polyprenyl-6-methoxyphenol hydroxylase-like FAD-dependent oxidoreductase
VPAVRSVVVVGGGISGLSLAIGLARAGIEVEVLEASPDGNVLGIGMALQAPALRALDSLGMLQACIEAGFAHETTTQLSLHGSVIESQPIPRPLGPSVPGQLGIQRKVFHGLLLDAAQRWGVSVRFGVTVLASNQRSSAVELTLSDGSRRESNLVVGADGAYSAMRRVLLDCDLVPEFTGQATWRIGVPRPPEVRGMCRVVGGRLSVGINPVTNSDAYIFVVDNVSIRQHVGEVELLARVPDLLRGYGGLVAELIGSVTDPSAVVYRPLDSLVLPPPWYRGRAILVGDAAHTTTPHMAAGALIAIQDAVVLADELRREQSVSTALEAFMARRYERCKLLVDACRQIGESQKAGDVRTPEAARLQSSVMAALASPL